MLSSVGFVSVAVCDEPAGKYEFYGYVHYADGTRLGERAGDEPQFDPGVLREGERTYLYTGFCGVGDKSRHGAMCTTLGPDMLTVIEDPVFVAPGHEYSAGTGFEGHAFFEGPSIRKRGGLYYFIYSSELCHELCYATSSSPRSGFTYGGCIVSAGDLGIDSYKPADQCMFYTANNHGSMECIDGDWYIFYHRHTNGTNYSRQGCFEKISFREDGSIEQAAISSNHGLQPLRGEGFYPAYIACQLFNRIPVTYVPWSGWMDDRFPKITQEGGDGDENYGYIANMRDGATAGYKVFEFQGVHRVTVCTKGYAKGFIDVKLSWDGDRIGSIPVDYANVWRLNSAEIAVPDGIHPLYFSFRGEGHLQFAGFGFEREAGK